MKTREYITLSLFFSLIAYRLFSHPSIATLLYIVTSWHLGFDSDVQQIINTDGEVEDDKFVHHFMPITTTYSGLPVTASYHYVECGSPDAEPILFFHGLAETWRVWKDQMGPLCETHRPIAIDSEGMGQSSWTSIMEDLPKDDVRGFYADMTMQLIKQLHIKRYNLVVIDYSFWTTMAILSHPDVVASHSIIRYGKFQSTVGVEDPARLPQSQMFKYAPETMNWLFNSNPYALVRILMGKPLLTFQAVLDNQRVGPKGLDYNFFNSIILSGISKNMYTPWVWFYNRGADMTVQMTAQRNSFEIATYPVSIVQARNDLGQPANLFDGTASMEIVEAPVTGFKEKIIRHNTTHKVVTKYSEGGEVIGPTAQEFFPNSPWVKFQFLDEVGHFIHLEAPKECALALQQLLRAEDPYADASWYM